jgi:hypothetical protein
MSNGILSQMPPHAADEAGIFVGLGWMADESGRFVDDQQFVVFVDDGKQFFQNERQSL